MGVSIRCQKTGRTIDLGYFGFARLRRKVAELARGPFFTLYQEVQGYSSLSSTESPEEFDARINAELERLVAAKQVDLKIADFLLQPDERGKIRYGACKNILKAIGDYNDKVLYGYAGRPDCARFSDFRRILEDCAATKSDLTWC